MQSDCAVTMQAAVKLAMALTTPLTQAMHGNSRRSPAAPHHVKECSASY
jgi:hypothetical protein